jgi:hypothetical protein
MTCTIGFVGIDMSKSSFDTFIMADYGRRMDAKPDKVALVAVIRKMLIILDATMRDLASDPA